MVSRSLSNFALSMTVFVCGALVMVYEIIGSRIVSPFIGTSTYVWTSLIGVILAALSLGYWLGGKMADRRPDLKILASVIFLAGGAVSVTILLKDIIMSLVASMPFGLEIRSVIAAVILFAPASVLLGFVTPYAVKLSISDIENSGSTVGRLYALSTIGSIVGTFSAGFLFVPFLGSVRTLYLIAAALIALSIILVPFSISRTGIGVFVLFALGVTASEANIYQLRQASGLYDIDTEYSRVQIFNSVDPRSKREIKAMATDPFFVQSAKFTDSDEIVFDYNRYYHLLRHFNPETTHSLMIGGAGYTFPRDYLKTYPNARIDVVEIDPQMTEIAREHFGLKDNNRLKIIHQDGRVFLNGASTAKYDAVLIDAFGSLFSVPYQLTTLEAVRNVDRFLSDDGVVVFNLGSAICGDSSKFLRAEFRTYKVVFPHVYLFKVNLDRTDEQLQNLMIVASKRIDQPPLHSDDEYIKNLLSRRYTREFSLDLPILTDDLNPVEYYNSFATSDYSIK